MHVRQVDRCITYSDCCALCSCISPTHVTRNGMRPLYADYAILTLLPSSTATHNSFLGLEGREKLSCDGEGMHWRSRWLTVGMSIKLETRRRALSRSANSCWPLDLLIQSGAKNGATLSHCKYSENFVTELRGYWWTSAMLYAEHYH